MNKFFKNSFVVVTSLILLNSCKKENPTILPYTVPDTYSFSNINYSEATARVNMWAGYTSYLGKSTTRQLSQDTTNWLWNNSNNPFTAEILVNLPNDKDALNNASFSLAGKTADALLFKAMADSMVAVSVFNGAAASEGVPGKIGNRLFNYSGLEFNQAIAKGMMGSLQLSAIIQHLNQSASADNSSIIAGTGTAMEHQWDLAFGYTAIPANYDSSISYANTVIDRPLAIGGYFKERASFIKAGGIIYEAFRKGRAAITAKDYAVRDLAIATIKSYLEKTLAAACYDYAGIGMTSADLASRFHALSEGYGFALALKYRQPGSSLTDANFQTLLNIFQSNFYQLNADASHIKLNQAKDILAAAYGQLQP